MSLPVRVSKENYAALRKEATRERRSIISQLDIILDQYFNGTPLDDNNHIDTTAVSPATSLELEKLYAIVVTDTGHIVKDKLTLQAAEKWLQLNNPDGDQMIMEMK
jgi:hypothetical protein